MCPFKLDEKAITLMGYDENTFIIHLSLVISFGRQ